MHCKISSPEQIIFDGGVKQITLPTEQWEITVLPGHTPLVTILKPWIVKILPENLQKHSALPNAEFLFEHDKIVVSVSKGMVFIDGANIMVLTSAVTATPRDSEAKLLAMKSELEQKVLELKKKGSIEDIEKSLIMLEKISADMKLLKIGKLQHTHIQ